MRSRLVIIGISVLFALLTLIPYGIAYGSDGEFRFTGFLFNPYDAASYLAKMRQGYDGQILYHLAFTENPGPGALVFTYYLLLGRLARLLGLPLIAVWHAARILGGAFFLTAAWEFFGRLNLSARGRGTAWVILLLGSGFGFLVILGSVLQIPGLPPGTYTADLWVAEYIPFLGMLTSAHFPLASGLILLLAMIIALPARPPTFFSTASACLLGTALASIQPFGFLPLGLAVLVWAIWTRLVRGRFPDGVFPHLAAAAIGFLPWIVYDFWMTQSLPQFKIWYSQNQTPSPPVWDVALSLGLPGIVAAVRLARWLLSRAAWREKLASVRSETLLPALWLALNLVLLYAPFPLQRRLMLGMWIPLAALAAPQIEAWVFGSAVPVCRALAAGIPLVLTNAVFLTILLASVWTRNRLLFLTRDEAAAVDWLNVHADGSVVLAPAEVAMWLPGMAGVRVVYGHPMETPGAEAALEDVETFYRTADEATRRKILQDHRVDWVVCAAEKPVCAASDGRPLQEAFTSESIKVLSVSTDQ